MLNNVSEVHVEFPLIVFHNSDSMFKNEYLYMNKKYNSLDGEEVWEIKEIGLE